MRERYIGFLEILYGPDVTSLMAGDQGKRFVLFFLNNQTELMTITNAEKRNKRLRVHIGKPKKS
jgi:hypothetical protein